MTTSAITAIIAATALLGGGALGAVVLTGDGETRQEVVRERGARVMPFSLDATTHVFEATPVGGVQRVVAKDPRDRGEIRLIRDHLRAEASAFERGDFADPAAIHGGEMPGLRELAAGHGRIDVHYRDLPDGAQITYRTTERSLAQALRRWFDAQLSDHGGDAQRSGDSAADHTPHDDHDD